MCVLCNSDLNDISHVLFKCNELKYIQLMLWNQVPDVCPGKLAEELLSMPIYHCTKLILNALNCDFVPECKDIYKSITVFNTTMFIPYDC